MVKIKQKIEIQSIPGFRLLKPVSIIIGIFCFVACLFLETRKEYIGIIFLPLSFIVVASLFNYRRSLRGLGSTLVYVFYLLRYTVFPLTIIMGGYRRDVSAQINEPYFNQACLIMVIELVAVFVVLTLFGWKEKSQLQERKEKQKAQGLERVCETKIFKIALLCFLVYDIVMYICYPSLLKYYWRFLFLLGDSAEYYAHFQQLYVLIPGYLFYPFKLTAELLHYLIPIFLVVKINRNQNSIAVNWILTILTAAFFVSIISPEQINSLIIGFIILYYMTIKYTRYALFLIMCDVLAVAVMAVFVFIKIADASDMGSLGRLINNYFLGPINIANSIYMKEHNFLGFAHLFEDLFAEIPVLSGLTNAVSINTIYGQYFNIPGAIMPMSGYGYYYFGYLGCWIPACVIVCFVNLFDSLSERNIKSEYRLLLYCCSLILALSLFMYNMPIVYSACVYTYVPCLVLYAIDNRYRRKKSKTNSMPDHIG